MESVWDFFDKVNDNIEIVSALMGIIGVSVLGLLKSVATKRKEESPNKCDMKGILVVVALLFVFFGMCIYTNNLILVPNIDNTSYEVAQQILENKGIKYQVINMSEYGDVDLKNTTVSLVNCKGGQHINQDKIIELDIVSVDATVIEFVDENNELLEVDTDEHLLYYIESTYSEAKEYAKYNEKNYEVDDYGVRFELDINSVTANCFLEDDNDEKIRLNWGESYYVIKEDYTFETNYEEARNDFELVYSFLLENFGEPDYVSENDVGKMYYYSWWLDEDKDISLIFMENRMASIQIKVR